MIFVALSLSFIVVALLFTLFPKPKSDGIDFSSPDYEAVYIIRERDRPRLGHHGKLDECKIKSKRCVIGG
jgi:hypothetical protein